jgi:hypothetical protein
LLLSVGPVRMFLVLGVVNSCSVFSAIALGTGVKLLIDLILTNRVW